MEQTCHEEAGFTLVELLVVLAIIGLLAALLLPALSAAKGYAKATDCKSHLRQLGSALQMYVHDAGERYPHYLGPAGPAYGDATGQGGRATGLVYWSSKLSPYYSLTWTNRAFHCPGYSGQISGPHIPGAIDRLGGYAYNTYGARIDDRTNEYFGLGPVLYWKDAQGNYVPPVSEAQVRVPSEMLAIGDSAMVKGFLAGSGLSSSSVPLAGGDDIWRCDPNAWLSVYAVCHGKNYNQVFADGHASGMSPSVLFNPSNTASLWNYDHQPHAELWTR